MRIDCTRYLGTLNKIKDSFIKTRLERSREVHGVAGDISLSTEVPLIAVVLFLKQDDLIGATPELLAMEKSLIDFYGYKEIIWIDK